ncbi:hypothetical protein HDV03_001121 [Kappamyces sp. JEL0829]|nr:hypothetical protein HDV03_001121 [Kappamyces sp. JEL0829]
MPGIRETEKTLSTLGSEHPEIGAFFDKSGALRVTLVVEELGLDTDVYGNPVDETMMRQLVLDSHSELTELAGQLSAIKEMLHLADLDIAPSAEKRIALDETLLATHQSGVKIEASNSLLLEVLADYYHHIQHVSEVFLAHQELISKRELE